MGSDDGQFLGRRHLLGDVGVVMREPLNGLKPASELAINKPHGHRVKYLGGCRCLPCRAAASRYESERRERKKAGDSNELVDTKPVVAHLRELSRKGVGYKAACEAARVGKSSVAMAMNGKRKRMRARHARAILAVTPEVAIRDGAIIDARPTLNLIRWLQNEGFSKAEIARRLGFNKPAIQFRDKITAINASKVERLVNQLRLGE